MNSHNRVVITTTHSAKAPSDELMAFAAASGWPLVERNRQGIPLMMEKHQVDHVVVWDNGSPVLHLKTGEKLFFHPSMAKNRLSLYRKHGLQDMMMKAIDLEPGDSFLDCTFGLGSDAIVASYFSQKGRILGLESSAPLAHVVGWGMRNYHSRMPWLDQAVHRIELINSEHQDCLAGMPDESFDVVYFDPMFREPMLKSASMSPLRPLTNHQALELRSVQQGLRVARKRVVIKERWSSGELERLGCQRLLHSKNHPIAYGIFDR